MERAAFEAELNTVRLVAFQSLHLSFQGFWFCARCRASALSSSYPWIDNFLEEFAASAGGGRMLSVCRV